MVAVTISREQQAFVQRRAQEAVASLEMGGEEVTRVWELYPAAGA